ncbi:MAG: UPF0175 family protein [Chthoniobacteraceae bacterium]
METSSIVPPDGNRRALEISALEAYRMLELSRRQIGELLGFSFYETEDFLKSNQATISLTMEEYERASSALSLITEP